MSELTKCNYCTLKSIERRTRLSGEKVITRPAKGGGIDVFRVKAGREHFAAWLMELTAHCVCFGESSEPPPLTAHLRCEEVPF